MTESSDKINGIFLGTAVGDSLGLTFEGLSRRRVEKMFHGPLRHRFVFGRGMVSDDTEHTLMVAQTLLDAASDPDRFARKFAWRLRFWFLSLPAGVGMATARACVKLLFGFSPKRSGVFSAGNGPAMRSALFGVVMEDKEKRRAFVEAVTRITHTDPKALTGALAVTEIAALAAPLSSETKPAIDSVVEVLQNIEPNDGDWSRLVGQMSDAWKASLTVQEFVDQLGLRNGVGGYVYQTVPVAIFAWYRHHGDFLRTVESVIRCGGDADTVGAIAGALAGATVGENGIPAEWIDGICDWPINPALLRCIGDRLTTFVETGESHGPVKYCWPMAPIRNLLFLVIVLLHGFRRLLPPY